MAWNFDSPLRFKRNIQFGFNENSIIQYRFERLRNFCTKCGSLKHDVKDCTLEFEEDDPDVPSGEDDDDLEGRDVAQQEISEANTLETIVPHELIPGLAMYDADHTPSGKETDASFLPSAFVDVELTTERLHYLHAKLVREMKKEDCNNDLVDAISGNDNHHLEKRNRVGYEGMMQRMEAAEDKAVLSHIRKKGKMSESAGSSSTENAQFGGAGGPVPPMQPG